MKLLRVIIISVTCTLGIHAESTHRADSLWTSMQQLYAECLKQCNAQDQERLNTWCHPFWQQGRAKLAHILQSSAQERFINDAFIRSTMVCEKGRLLQTFHELYLIHCIRDQTRAILHAVSDTDFGNLPKASVALKYSMNTLLHTYYLARVIEGAYTFNPSMLLNTIVEVGGGYGNLARLIKQTFPAITLVIIDLPETNALQWFFLHATMPHANIVFHKTAPVHVVEQAVNLVPLHLLPTLDVKADCFISTLALSECTPALQSYIVDRSFFSADVCYLSGQINGWNNKYAAHEFLFNAVRGLYKRVLCQPFPLLNELHSLPTYEIVAQKE